MNKFVGKMYVKSNMCIQIGDLGREEDVLKAFYLIETVNIPLQQLESKRKMNLINAFFPKGLNSNKLVLRIHYL
jgi:hypothetical protein